jgi:acetoacetyl-CoA reductase/3-oxoacyl-[acyl-carrier protein] reductase
MFEQIYKKFGRLDVLVNMAGINRDGPLVSMGPEDWETVVATILTGTFYCSQAFAQRYSGNDGNIINIGAVTALSGRKNGVNYCSARAGILAMTKCLALELAPRIRVNTVTPGYIDTEEVRGRHQLTEPAKRAAAEARVPLGRLGVPDDIASMIAYLIQGGPYITGQNFQVDGGYYMR